jgi:exopolyphosphatase/guanosine-5'-triphosphate,3'-diphosphate pyrophosphatase
MEKNLSKKSPEQTLAAIDLGSNSFHINISRLENGQLQPCYLNGKKVQLAAGMQGGLLAADAVERGLRCVQRFKAELQNFPVSQLRVVATNALRLAANREAFIEPAEQLLGVPVEIISGQEEARLVYLGVIQNCSGGGVSRLVIDIGGGSTELALGQGAELQQLSSLQMGCVAYLRFFEGGEISEANFQQAYQAACAELEAVKSQFDGQWRACIGSSGTLLAVEQVLIQHSLAEAGIHREGLAKLRELLLSFDHLDEVSFHGLKESRRQVFASGLAIVLALFNSLDIESISLSDASLREGVLLDLLAGQ